MTDSERIADLERRVKELESQPRETHTHFHNYPPVYQPPSYAPYVSPAAPGRWIPPWAGDNTTPLPYVITWRSV